MLVIGVAVADIAVAAEVVNVIMAYLPSLMYCSAVPR